MSEAAHLNVPATSRQMAPVWNRKIRQFSGADPWRELTSTEWTINAYLMVQESAQGTACRPENIRNSAVAGNQSLTGRTIFSNIKSEAFGLCDADGRCHMMPGVLTQMWQAGRITDIELPPILHAIEESLEDDDYEPFFRLSTLKPQVGRRFCTIFIGFGAALLVTSLFGRTLHSSFWMQASPAFLRGGFGCIVLALLALIVIAMKQKRTEQRRAIVAEKVRQTQLLLKKQNLDLPDGSLTEPIPNSE